jgi:hypothetical protein
MLLIFGLSTNAGAPNNTSRIIGPIVRWLVPGISDEALGRVVFGVRKTSHVAEYAVLALLCWRARRHSVVGQASSLPPGLPAPDHESRARCPQSGGAATKPERGCPQPQQVATSTGQWEVPTRSTGRPAAAGDSRAPAPPENPRGARKLGQIALQRQAGSLPQPPLRAAVRPWRWPDAAFAFVVAVAFAASDEWHQSFVPSRQGSGWDFLLDSAGAAFGLIVLWRLGRWCRRW